MQLTRIFKLKNVDKNFENKPFGRQLDDLRAIAKFKETAKSVWISQKRRSTAAAMKEFKALYLPTEYYAEMGKESSTYRDDTFQVWYTNTTCPQCQTSVLPADLVKVKYADDTGIGSMMVCKTCEGK